MILLHGHVLTCLRFFIFYFYFFFPNINFINNMTIAETTHHVLDDVHLLIKYLSTKNKTKTYKQEHYNYSQHQNKTEI
ncbi:hypothetical protein RhiirC2_207504 [Rhizophagus irregularis]|uniref:Uncharacterized protein n=1 Tax=Rhizophagus irregularis TaxID=588596 RepID=A0A2N1NPL5_9GLOM|nr:hypothetical protein RhiirC2_207504 [Rhizophagus irregularis]